MTTDANAFRFEYLAGPNVVVPLTTDEDTWPNEQWSAEAARLTQAVRAHDPRVQVRVVDADDENYPAVEVRWNPDLDYECTTLERWWRLP